MAINLGSSAPFVERFNLLAPKTPLATVVVRANLVLVPADNAGRAKASLSSRSHDYGSFKATGSGPVTADQPSSPVALAAQCRRTNLILFHTGAIDIRPHQKL